MLQICGKMRIGEVKFFQLDGGWGFIKVEGGRDVFFHLKGRRAVVFDPEENGGAGRVGFGDPIPVTADAPDPKQNDPVVFLQTADGRGRPQARAWGDGDLFMRLEEQNFAEVSVDWARAVLAERFNQTAAA